MPYRTSRIQWARAISSLSERNSGCALMHMLVEQIVHSGEHHAVDQKGCCEEHEFRKYAGIHKVSWDGFLKRFICGCSADELRSAHCGDREPAAHYHRHQDALHRFQRDPPLRSGRPASNRNDGEIFVRNACSHESQTSRQSH
jgi:hypothetical protein